MSLWGSNLNFFIIPAHHFLIALNKMHTYGNYMTSSYKWHLSEGENYNEVVLTNTFLKFRPCMTVTSRSLMLAWWLSGIGTMMAWIQLCMFFTLGTSLQLHCLSRGSKRGFWLCIWNYYWEQFSSLECSVIKLVRKHTWSLNGWLTEHLSKFLCFAGFVEYKGQETVFYVLHFALSL